MTDIILKRPSPYRMAVDIGGTFTDGITEDVARGRIWVGKCLTTPEDPGIGVSDVIDQMLLQMKSADSAISPASVRDIVHATTLVTNTLIERRGARVALILTAGTRDLLEIAREVRYDLYDLDLELPAPLVELDDCFELQGRIDADGSEFSAIDPDELNESLGRISAGGYEAVAICLLHAYANDRHEKMVEAALTQRLPRMRVSLSSRVAPLPREYERASTVAANAYVQPLVADYLNMLRGEVCRKGIDCSLSVMLSSGGFTGAEAAARSPIQLLESGPAAGVLSANNAGGSIGEAQLLAFDMGGTTAKACVIADGEPGIIHSFETARVKRFKKGSGLPILVPSIDLIEIGAGGGSIAAISALGTLAIGPRSAGSVPGPVCYGRGGIEPTVTDADLILGYLDPLRFLGGEMKLDLAGTQEALARLGNGLGMSAMETAWGICSIVNENMANAARVHIAERGFDPRRFALVATGGAGPVHAVDVARRLRISRILCPMAAGAGSCIGLLAAAPRAERNLPRRAPLSNVGWNDVGHQFDLLRRDAATELSSAGADTANVEWSLVLDMRYEGQGHNVDVTLPYDTIDASLADDIRALFDERYRHLFGGLVPDGRLEIVNWRLIGSSPSTLKQFTWADGRSEQMTDRPRGRREIFLPLENNVGVVDIYDRYSLPGGTRIRGPLILEERESTFVVPFPSDVLVHPNLTIDVRLDDEVVR